MTENVIEEVEVIEPNGNVIQFSKEMNRDEEDFTFSAFLTRSKEFEKDVKDFVFIGTKENGETTVSAKAENNMHLYWMVKRFLTHLEDNLFA